MKLLTVDQFAERLALKPSTIRKWIFERRVGVVRIGKRAIRLHAEEADKLIQNSYRPPIHER